MNVSSVPWVWTQAIAVRARHPRPFPARIGSPPPAAAAARPPLHLRLQLRRQRRPRPLRAAARAPRRGAGAPWSPSRAPPPRPAARKRAWSQRARTCAATNFASFARAWPHTPSAATRGLIITGSRMTGGGDSDEGGVGGGPPSWRGCAGRRTGGPGRAPCTPAQPAVARGGRGGSRSEGARDSCVRSLHIRRRCIPEWLKLVQ